MAGVRVEVQPSVLAWARARSGVDHDVLARRFPRLDAWMSGHAAPTLKQLQAFARGTRTPVGFFFLDEAPVDTLPIADLRTVAGATPATSNAEASVDLLGVIYVCQARQDWYRTDQLAYGEPALEWVGSVDTNDSVEDVAGRMGHMLDWTPATRAACTGTDMALRWLREHAEELGVLVMISGIVGDNAHRPLSPREFRGFALTDRHAPLVFVNGADSKAAQVFTLVHELAHIWLGETALSSIDPRVRNNHPVERWCNRVAAEFLVPMQEFRANFEPEGDLRGQLRPLAEHFRVSTQVILGRAREAGLMSWEQYLRALDIERQRVAEIAAKPASGGNYYNNKAIRTSKRFAQALIASTLEGRTTYTEAFRLLELKKGSTFDRLAQHLGVG